MTRDEINTLINEWRGERHDAPAFPGHISTGYLGLVELVENAAAWAERDKQAPEPATKFHRVIMEHRWAPDYVTERISAKMQFISENYPTGIVENIIVTPEVRGACYCLFIVRTSL